MRIGRAHERRLASLLIADDDEARKMAEASKEYMRREFGEAEDEYRLSAAVLRLYVAYVHAAATLPVGWW